MIDVIVYDNFLHYQKMRLCGLTLEHTQAPLLHYIHLVEAKTAQVDPGQNLVKLASLQQSPLQDPSPNHKQGLPDCLRYEC